MINKEMERLINYLINLELNSSYLYLAMSNYFNRINLKGFSHWLSLQSQEENEHAMKLIQYLIDRGGVVDLRALPNQPSNFGTPINAFQQILAHEQFMTKSYKQAYEVASREKDQQALVILQEFLQEQVDEEAQTEYILSRLELVKNNPAGLLLLDQELGKRE